MQDGISRVLTRQIDYISVKINTGWERRQKKLLLMTISEAHSLLKEQSRLKIGLTKFTALRPAQVKPRMSDVYLSTILFLYAFTHIENRWLWSCIDRRLKALSCLEYKSTSIMLLTMSTDFILPGCWKLLFCFRKWSSCNVCPRNMNGQNMMTLTKYMNHVFSWSCHFIWSIPLHCSWKRWDWEGSSLPQKKHKET